VDCVELLIDLGAKVNAKNQITGATPLHCAIQSSKAPEKRVQVIQLLLEKGKADVSLGDSSGAIPLEYCSEDDDELMQLLQPVAPPIVTAIQDKQVEQVESILREDPAAAESRYLSQTPLLLVVDQLLETNDVTHIQIMEILLKHGADPHTSSMSHAAAEESHPPLYLICTALRDAHRSSNHEVIATLTAAARILFEYGARPTTESTQFLLHDAARRGYIPFLDFLVTTLNMDINTPGRQGMTPLHFAARSGQTKMVQHLLQTYPDLNRTAKDDRNQTPLDAAKANDKNDIVVLLEQRM
jgi:ankyrin repeat protein